MNTSSTKRILGFTVIELMITLVIVAVLMALAYPAYTDYVRKSRRGEGQQLLLNWATNQEIWRSNNPTYASTTNLPAPTSGYYGFATIGTPTATTYTLEAAASGDQTNDKAKDGSSCATLTLNQDGVKSPASCWD